MTLVLLDSFLAHNGETGHKYVIRCAINDPRKWDMVKTWAFDLWQEQKISFDQWDVLTDLLVNAESEEREERLDNDA